MDKNETPAPLAEHCTCGLTPISNNWSWGHMEFCCFFEPIVWKRRALRDAAAFGATVPPETCPSQSLLDLLTPAVLAAQPKSGIRQALRLLLQELARRGSPAYGDLSRTPALLAEQVSPWNPLLCRPGAASYSNSTSEYGSGATASVQSNSPPGVTFITPPDQLTVNLQAAEEVLKELARYPSPLLTVLLKKDSQ